MWAGVWIDGQFSKVERLIRSIAEDHFLAGRLSSNESPPPPSPPAQHPVCPTGVRCADAERIPPRTLVFARSGGYCEIMAGDCGLAANAIVSRVPDYGGGDASTLFAVCQECAIKLQRMDSQIMQRLGYRVEQAHAVSRTPFFWRQRHRLLLDSGGALCSAAPVARQHGGWHELARVPGPALTFGLD
jgi:hypothetical protein